MARETSMQRTPKVCCHCTGIPVILVLCDYVSSHLQEYIIIGLLVFQSIFSSVRVANDVHPGVFAWTGCIAKESQGGTLPCEMQTRKQARKDIGGSDDPVPLKPGQGRPLTLYRP